jgi:hypothetical protein
MKIGKRKGRTERGFFARLRTFQKGKTDKFQAGLEVLSLWAMPIFVGPDSYPTLSARNVLTCGASLHKSSRA